jgi:hypothetical protein
LCKKTKLVKRRISSRNSWTSILAMRVCLENIVDSKATEGEKSSSPFRTRKRRIKRHEDGHQKLVI